ncbi:MAG: hypothetical protein KJP15_10195 [Gammaproteobacteria bacterium]|nr:hypothetical protein [Gammaproteobacteria bacterium]
MQSSFIFLRFALFLAVSGIVNADSDNYKHDSDSNRYSVADVKGNYGFSFDGEVVGVAPVAAIGAIRADGRGNITKAIRTISVGGLAITQTFTCTLKVGPNGTGSATCPLDNPAHGFPPVETFDFVIEDDANAFRLVGTTPGIVVFGSGRRQ